MSEQDHLPPLLLPTLLSLLCVGCAYTAAAAVGACCSSSICMCTLAASLAVLVVARQSKCPVQLARLGHYAAAIHLSMLLLSGCLPANMAACAAALPLWPESQQLLQVSLPAAGLIFFVGYLRRYSDLLVMVLPPHNLLVSSNVKLTIDPFVTCAGILHMFHNMIVGILHPPFLLGVCLLHEVLRS